MKISKNKLRQIIKEEKRKILNEEVSLSKAPCPHATADSLLSSGMSAGEILGWVSSLVSDLSQAEVSPPGSTVLELPAGIGGPVAMESSFKRKTQSSKPGRRIAGVIPGYGFMKS